MVKIFFLSFSLIILVTGCRLKNNKSEVEIKNTREIYENIFGEKYLVANGSLLNIGKDSIENGLWQYTSLERRFVLFGDYSNGFPTGTWTFLQSGGTGFTSQWDIYSNSVRPCAFSVPFVLKDSVIDARISKLTTMNDSLGKITIIVSVDDKLFSEQEVDEFNSQSDLGIREQGYTYSGNHKKFRKGENEYFFDEYFLKDSLNKTAKLYRLYGNDPQKNFFVQFTLFHAGPKEDLVKVIYSLMVTSLYIDRSRFLNPYVLSNLISIK